MFFDISQLLIFVEHAGDVFAQHGMLGDLQDVVEAFDVEHQMQIADSMALTGLGVRCACLSEVGDGGNGELGAE